MIRRIGIVAANVLRHSIRDRLFYAILVFGLVLVAASSLVENFTIGVGDRVLRDVGTAAIDLVGLMLAIALGTMSVSREVEKKNLYALLATPLGRADYIIGKFLGMAITLCLSVVAMFLLLVTFLSMQSLHALPWGTLFIYLLLRLTALVLIMAIAMLLSTFASATLSAFGALGLYVAGALSQELHRSAQRAEGILGQWLGEAIYYLVPHFDFYDVSHQVAYGLPVSGTQLGSAILYGLLYGLAVVCLAVVVFRRRDLT